MEKHIYNEIVKRGIQHANHCSDLYIPVTQETAQLLKEYDLRATTFENQVEGGIWYDVPFQYLPYWDRKAKDDGRLALGTKERDDQERYFDEHDAADAEEDDNG